MKNLLKYFALAAVVAAFASCDKVEAPVETPVAKDDAAPLVAPLKISAATETKSILRNDTDVCWVSTDTLSVFDNANNYYGFHNANSAAAETTDFVFDSWPSDKTPEFAVYCNTYANNTFTRPSFNGSKATALLYANQKLYNKKSYSKLTGLSVGEVSYDGTNYSVGQMKNCYSLIQFKVKNADILSISVQGTNNEQLGGWVDIDPSKIKAIGEDNHTDPFWVGTAGQTQSKIIRLETTGNGGVTSGENKVFDNNSYYYLAVLPQIVQGLSFTVKKVDGTEETQVINGPIALNRSKIRKLKHPVDSALFQPANFIELDCTDANKFKRAGDIQIPTRNNTTGSNYDFWLEDYPSYLFNGDPYRWQGCLCTLSGTSIKLPNITGYTLYEMTITYQYSTKTPKYEITDGTTSLASFSMNKDLLPKTLDVSAYPQSSTSPDRYLFVTGEGNIKFTLKYVPVSN